MKSLVVLLISLMPTYTVLAQEDYEKHLPDKSLTPGVICTPRDKDFFEYRYPSKIAYCKRNVSTSTKKQVMRNYGLDPAFMNNYEIDHLIPLAAGGSNSIKNLWPQILTEAHSKDVVEREVYYGLFNDTMTQEEAIQKIWDWFEY